MSIQNISTPPLRFGNVRPVRVLTWPDVPALLRRPSTRTLLIDVAVIAIAALDVWLAVPGVPVGTESTVLSWLACAALLFRRRFPLAAVLGTVPGFFAGWAQLAAMIAVGYLAYRVGMSWKTWLGAGLVFLCRFVTWPLPEMADLPWQQYGLDVIYGGVVAAMPVAIGLLVAMRQDLLRRYRELEENQLRERHAYARAVRADERAKLAREMHDVVSHEVTLIAMQANAMECASSPDAMKRAAESIRSLSTRALEELRSLLGMLRADSDEELPAPGLDALGRLVRDVDVPVRLTVEQLPADIPPQVSAAAFRTVQEALTNVHKHAPGATATIRVHYAYQELRVEVRNDKPRERPRCTPKLPSGGHGLAGLAERAMLLNGTFHARSTADGGFEVRAHYPLKQ
ncbi:MULTISPECIES: histidine kinase [Thermocrispum]|jgi:signal transduction histidine kinase|uniref:histidine kinase n=1 Tax=Thermocrispum agreste TaxID=37925 RepID=A0A2W4LJP2_9PSEU|nr:MULTISPECIES: histidine kinase [Thermocrispum]PZN01420.1 MAG: sensor histidine kinase [Thermocrispum agreste]